jgi:glucokinase
MARAALAVDIGATKIALAIVGKNFAVEEKTELVIGPQNSRELWSSICRNAEGLLSGLNGDLIGVGIGSAGPIHLDGGSISPVNIPIWREFPIVKKFQELAGHRNVVLHGDAMALAHAEHILGAGRGVRNMLGMVVSTGVGGGLIIDNKVFTGDSGNASFIGHQTINFDGAECACGRRGCVETYASGPRMVAIANERGWHGGTSFIELAEAARNGEAIALEVIEEGARALAIGIVNTLGNLDIHTVVVGGGVSQAGEIYWEPLRKHLALESKYAGFLDDINLRAAALDRNAGLIGAALGVLDDGSL